MTFDVRGSLKNTRISNNCYVVIHELLSNAIDSYLIRKGQDPKVGAFRASIETSIYPAELIQGYIDLEIICTDNGAGFQDPQTKAFVTKDTTYKDDLPIKGIGRCKGLGRVQFLHFFSRIGIESIFTDEHGQLAKRQLSIDENTREITESDFHRTLVDEEPVGTKIVMHSLRDDGYQVITRTSEVDQVFNAESIRSNVLSNFLHLLVTLKDELGAFEITFGSDSSESGPSQAKLSDEDLPLPNLTTEFSISYSNNAGEISVKSERFKITQYKLPASQGKRRNIVALCARSSIVIDITKRYLRKSHQVTSPTNDCYHIILVESSFFDAKVNEQRDSFYIEEFNSNYHSISWADFYEELDLHISELLAPPGWSRDEVVNRLSHRFGISKTMLDESRVRVMPTDDETSVAMRILEKYQTRIVNDTAEIVDLRDEISSLDPSRPGYRELINNLAWKFTSSIKYSDMANLSQTVVRRDAVVSILAKATALDLLVQAEANDDARQRNEELIHNIFFPYKKDSHAENDHDIWLLNEEWQFFDYVASDIPLSKYKCFGELVFQEDIDEELAKHMADHIESNRRARPDIAIFCEEGAVIIIEFKAPGVPLNEHLADLPKYATLLAMKSGGKLRKFYGYLVGNKTDSLGMSGQGWIKLPNSKCYFRNADLTEPETEKRIGTIYMEMMHYEDIVARARKRLDVFKQKLGLA